MVVSGELPTSVSIAGTTGAAVPSQKEIVSGALAQQLRSPNEPSGHHLQHNPSAQPNICFATPKTPVDPETIPVRPPSSVHEDQHDTTSPATKQETFVGRGRMAELEHIVEMSPNGRYGKVLYNPVMQLCS